MRTRGFTLIEVVVAAAIFGMAATVLFGLFSRSLFNLRKIEDLHRYQLAGEEVMNRVMTLKTLPADGHAQGNVEDLDAAWSVSVQPWIPETLESKPSEAVVKIDVDVTWPGRSSQRTVHLETVKPVLLSYEMRNFEQAIAQAFPR